MNRSGLLLLACSFSVSAQVFTARLSGTIQDPAGAPVPGATVTATQVSTNAKRSSVTESTGVYIIPLLLPGTYEVRVEAPGFQPQIRKDIELGANQTATLDFALRIADVTQTVDVTGDVPLLQTETTNLATTIDARTIEQFPLVQRDIMGLLRAVPGVVAKGQVGDARGGRGVFNSNFSVGGGRTASNEVLIDGSANTIGDFNGVVISPPPDSVQEFRVETNAFAAEFGRTGGGVVNTVTKAGTNRYNGTAYYFHQNDAFNANSFGNNRFGLPKAILRRHQYGYSLGGPVRIPKLYNGTDKTFFFSAWEGRREKDPVQAIFSVPTEAERRGDFSNTVFLGTGGVVTPIIIYDPNTSRVVNGVRSRLPFAGNVIPPDRINPIARRLVAEYPAPNRTGSQVTNRGNYAFQGARSYRRDIFTNRVDHYLSERHRLFGRWTWQENFDENPSTTVRFTNSNSTKDNYKNFALDDTYTLTPRLNNVFRYSYTRYRANLRSNTLGFDPTTLGFPNYVRDNASILFYPNIAFGGDTTFPQLGGTAYNNQPRDTQGLQEQMVYVRGRHNFKFGAEYRLYRFYPFQTINPTGNYNFSRAFTQSDQLGNPIANQGFPLASMMLGFGAFSYEHVEPLSVFHHYVGAYFQDDFKLSTKLTLNLGLRWDIETGTAEAHDRLSYFDPEADNPLTRLGAPKGAVVFAGGKNPRTIRAANKANFGPRIGVAYRLDNRTALRAGYGLFFLPLGVEAAIVTTPFNYTVNADVLNTDNSPRTLLSNPFPGGITTPPSATPVRDGSYRIGLDANTVLREQAAPHIHQWNLAIGRQIARTTVADITYFGSRGVHLMIPTMSLNQLDALNLAQGRGLTDLVSNPFVGAVTDPTSLLSRPTIPRMQLLKPYPQFAAQSTANAFNPSLTFFRPPVGDSVYHAVTFRFERRFTKGLSVNAHYTISKLLDNGGAGNGAAFLDPSAYRDVNNKGLERSVGSFDVPQRLVVMYSVDVPFGKGKKFLNNNAFLDRIIGGWNIFAFHTWQKGLPVALGTANLSRLAGDAASRVSVVGGVDPRYSLEQSIANARAFNPVCQCTAPWFNPAAFSSTPEFVIPNGARFQPNIREGNLRNTDVTVQKALRIVERYRIQIRGGFFNIFNQVTFNGPSVIDPTRPNFGSAGGTQDNSRRIEVGARILF